MKTGLSETISIRYHVSGITQNSEKKVTGGFVEPLSSSCGWREASAVSLLLYIFVTNSIYND